MPKMYIYTIMGTPFYGGLVMENFGNEITECNFGGMVPISTVDWPGHASMVIFLKGCPNICKDCHNRHLLKEDKTKPMADVIDEIKLASQVISAFVVSGGEPTKHIEEVKTLLKTAKKYGLLTRVQTSGVYPEAIEELISKNLVDSIALDFKVDPTKMNTVLRKGFDNNVVIKSLSICETHYKNKTLQIFEVVHTIFPYEGYEQQLIVISNAVGTDTPFVLQQGIPRDRTIKPLPRTKLLELTNNIKQKNVRIRSMSNGEEVVRQT